MSSAMNLKNSFHMKYDKKLLDRELVLTRKISVSAMIVLRTSKLLQYLFLWHWRDNEGCFSLDVRYEYLLHA